MAGNSKKYRSKMFRIGVEGATTDGRTIERSWLEEMAASYSPNTYGARINVEHIKGLSPDSPFGAYGDVLALKTEEVEINGEKKLALFAQIQPNDALLALNKKGQKIYTSMEIQPKFANTGKAYLVGLAVTDSPASLGTEALEFSAKNGTFASRKQDKDNLFTAAEPAELEFEEVDDTPSKVAGLFKKVSELLGKGKQTEEQFGELAETLEAIAKHSADQAEALTAEQTARKSLETSFAKLESDLQALTKQLGNTPDPEQFTRPPATGGDGQQLAKF
ncbi:GPO family capsid scaffolding protein [Stutzerimonas frequens]|uniref:GPO family capsid scaffolding protein n=1 Tax=Stutzerimonas frequens TaxID=2968969 RepID=UPI00293524EF|nr:GPO family capsid scaffolding protein [Stutzerimonas frequens]WOC77626.1 GPO family capsid scaffolding protein [Stutzerimonas frequens]